MSALLKIPYILLVSLAFHNAFTSPSAATPEERTPVTSLGERIVSWGLLLMGLRKAILLGLGAIEILVILATLGGDRVPNAIGTSGDLYLTPISISGMYLIVSGSLIRWWCYREMKHLFTFHISIRKDHTLVTTGPYSVVRHPGYAGTAMVHVGMYCWFGARGAWLRESQILDTVVGKVVAILFAAMMTNVLVGLIRRVSVEDAMLKKMFGKQWDAWARQIPYALVPGIY